MAELSSLGFTPGTGMMYRLDPRTKQLLLLMLSLAVLAGKAVLLTTITGFIVLGLLVGTNLRFANLLREIRYFLIFLALLALVRSCSLGEDLRLLLTMGQVQAALVFCWRLLLIVLMGVILVTTTRTGAMRASLIWFLKPLPLVNEQAAATMVGLVVRFLPLVLFQAGEIGDAMRARGAEERKYRPARMIRFTITLFRRVFLRADELVDSMQARCYSEARTIPLLAFSGSDYAALALGAAALAAALWPGEPGIVWFP